MSASGRVLSRAAERAGRQSKLEPLAQNLAARVERTVGHGAAKDALSGTWLGHPVHPLLTDLPIGFWTSAFALDFLGGTRARPAATRLVALGVLSALPTAAAGAADWSDTSGPPRRVGVVHAAASATALGCYAVSWVERRRARHLRGVVWGVAGAAAATVGGFLGGHLLQTLGVGVDRTALRAPPEQWTAVTSVSAIGDAPRCFLAAAAPVIVFRRHDEVVALDAQCPHRGAPMETADLAGDVLTCPWHGSEFHVPDGALVRGPSVVSLPRYDCRVVDGTVEVRSRP